MTVEYIARIKCDICGKSIEALAYADTEPHGLGYFQYDKGIMNYDDPEGWLSGIVYEGRLCDNACPECVVRVDWTTKTQHR